MKHALIFRVFLLTLPFLPVAKGQIMVLTYNLRLDVASDGPDNWHQRKKDLGEYLMDQNPDFLGIQEGLVHQVKYLDSILVNMEYIGQGREGGEKGEFSPVYFDTTKWKLEDSEMFWLSETPSKVSKGWDAACHRVCTMGLFSDRTGNRIVVLNTHFDHVGQQARVESARLILQRIKSYGPDMPLVLMGDFNVESDNIVYTELHTVLSDAGAVPNQSTLETGTFNAFQLKGYKNRRIDFIFHNTRLNLIDYKVNHPLTKKGRQLSDHFPVMASFNFK